MKQKDSGRPKNRGDQELRILQELEGALEELPLLEMIDSVKTISSPEPQIREDIEAAGDLIDRLEVLAFTGQKEALAALRDLGTRVSDILFRISKSDYGKQSPPSGGSADCEFHVPHSMEAPVVRLRGDFSGINKILSREMEALLDSGLISAIPLQLGKGEIPNDITIDIIDSLHWRDDLASKVKRKMEELAEDKDLRRDPYLDHPLERLHLLGRRSAILEFVKESEVPRIEAEAAVHDRIRRLLEQRFAVLCRHHGPVALAEVASRSMKWPTAASAAVEENKAISDYVKGLRLGVTNAFRLAQKSGGGRDRNFEPGSPVCFALEICMELEMVRQSYVNSSKEELNKIREKAGQISDHKLLSIREAKAALEEGKTDTTFDPGRRQTAFTQKWNYAAALLPEFPQANKPSSDAFNKWLAAAKLRAEAKCLGDWENYPWWPRCVLTRSEEGNRPRSKREAVGEKLRIGMRRLER